ncbi:MAG TPA: nuclear transport factor 2 family protein [Chthonomonadaceae bacterium]|nr:nuclear transport factor 2 family protein [Chthonomonadaceae bacterium]
MTPLEIVQAATRAFNAGNLEEALAYYDDAVVQRSPATGEQPGFKIREGKAALRQVLEADASKGVQFHHLHYICEGNIVAAEGINRGILNGVAVEQPVAIFYEIRDDKIAQVTVYYDRLVLSKIAPRKNSA